MRMHTDLCRQVAVGGEGVSKTVRPPSSRGRMWLHVLRGLTSFNETLRGARGALNRRLGVGCFGMPSACIRVRGRHVEHGSHCSIATSCWCITIHVES